VGRLGRFFDIFELHDDNFCVLIRLMILSSYFVAVGKETADLGDGEFEARKVDFEGHGDDIVFIKLGVFDEESVAEPVFAGKKDLLTRLIGRRVRRNDLFTSLDLETKKG